jgi:hypothetical protein
MTSPIDVLCLLSTHYHTTSQWRYDDTMTSTSWCYVCLQYNRARSLCSACIRITKAIKERRPHFENLYLSSKIFGIFGNFLGSCFPSGGSVNQLIKKSGLIEKDVLLFILIVQFMIGTPPSTTWKRSSVNGGTPPASRHTSITPPNANESTNRFAGEYESITYFKLFPFSHPLVFGIWTLPDFESDGCIHICC